MSDDDLSLLSTVPDHPEEVTEPVRPMTQEYEAITVRLLAMGFSGGPQDLVLYPEDVIEEDAHGNIRVLLHSMGGGEFIAYVSQLQWHSLKEMPHKRVKGTLRPTPEQVTRDYMERQQREKDLRVAALHKQLAELEQGA